MTSASPEAGRPSLGAFTPAAHGFWVAECRLHEQPAFEVSVSNELNLDASIAGITEMLCVLQEQMNSVRNAVSEALVATHNDGWNETDSPITTAQFAEQMGDLKGVTFWEADVLEAYFDDGDLFWDHMLLVDVAKDGTASNARFEG